MDKMMFDFKVEAAKRKAKEAGLKMKEGAEKVVMVAMEHPMESIALATAVIGSVNKISKAVAAKAEDRRRTLDLYDPRTGMHSWTRRPLKPSERLRIDERYARGESYAKILYDMGLLK
jgi:hypothetical protein